MRLRSPDVEVRESGRTLVAGKKVSQDEHITLALIVGQAYLCHQLTIDQKQAGIAESQKHQVVSATE